jgi:hypothetical protein
MRADCGGEPRQARATRSRSEPWAKRSLYPGDDAEPIRYGQDDGSSTSSRPTHTTAAE